MIATRTVKTSLCVSLKEEKKLHKKCFCWK